MRPSGFCPGLRHMQYDLAGPPPAALRQRWPPAPRPTFSVGAKAHRGPGVQAAPHTPIIRIITVVVRTRGPARGEGWAAWKLGLRSGCLAQPTNLQHINLHHLLSGVEVPMRHGSPRATSCSTAGTQPDLGTGVLSISQVHAGGRPGGGPEAQLEIPHCPQRSLSAFLGGPGP